MTNAKVRQAARLEFDRFVYDPADATLADGESATTLTLRPQLARLLEAFLAQPETVIEREALCRQVWGNDAVVDFESGLAALIKELRQALGERADGSRLLQTLPRRGFRLNASVRRYSSWRVIRSQAPLILAAAVIGTLLLVLLMGRASSPLLGPQQSSPERQTEWALAVLPVAVFGDRTQVTQHIEWLLADNLLAQLWQAELESLELIGRTSTQPYLGLEDRIPELAEGLDIDLLMEGSLDVQQQAAHLQLRLLAVPKGTVVWQYSRSEPHHALVPGELASDAVAELAAHWPHIRQRLQTVDL